MTRFRVAASTHAAAALECGTRSFFGLAAFPLVVNRTAFGEAA
jgi:hypothetical protein